MAAYVLTVQCASSNSKPTWIQPDTRWAHASVLSGSFSGGCACQKKKKAQSVLKPLLRATSAERGHRKSINKYIWTPAGLIMRVDISMHQHDILSLSYYEMCATAYASKSYTHTQLAESLICALYYCVFTTNRSRETLVKVWRKLVQRWAEVQD